MAGVLQVKIPPSDLEEYQLEKARTVANELATSRVG